MYKKLKSPAEAGLSYLLMHIKMHIGWGEPSIYVGPKPQSRRGEPP